MLTAVFNGVGDVGTRQVDEPRIEAPTDAVVRIRAAGVCGSDLWYFRGDDPLDPGSRLGHEFVGVVEELGSEVTGLRVGDPVVAPFSYADGDCATCRSGLPTSCPAMGVWGGAASPGGAQAEAIRVPFASANLVRLPEPASGLEDLLRYLPLADLLPTAVHAVTCGDVGPRSTVAIIGDGPIALATVLAARRRGVERLFLLGHHDARLGLAEKLGAPLTAHSPAEPAHAAEVVRTHLGGPVDAVLDCVGTQPSVDAALAAVRDGGTLSYVGLPVTGAAIALLDTFDRNLTIRGGIAPAAAYIPGLLAEVADGRLDLSALLDLRLPLTEVAGAYAGMAAREAIKAVVCP